MLDRVRCVAPSGLLGAAAVTTSSPRPRNGCFVELADYLKILRRRWWLPVLAVVVCVAAATGLSLMEKPRYTATTRLLVVGAFSSTGQAGDTGQGAAQQASTLAQLIQTGPALAIAAQAANAAGQNPVVTAQATSGTPFLVISVEADSAQAASAMATSYLKALPRIVQVLEQSNVPAPNVTLLEPAVLPTSPSSPKPLQDLPIAFVLGLIIGLAGTLLWETLDARIRDTAELERLAEVTLLGAVPKELVSERMPAATKPRSSRAEAYRHVRTNLEFVGAEGMPRSVVVTSPGPGEGKSSLVANLAVVAAQAGRHVVIVDADLRKPSQHHYFAVEASAGLSDVLSGRVALRDALVATRADRVTLLCSGSSPQFPSELVGSASMVQLIEDLEQHFDLVLIDTPPVLPVSDALLLGVHAAGVVVVARMAESRRASVKRAVESIRKVDGPLIGVVGNAVVRHEEKTYGSAYRYGYGSKVQAGTHLPSGIAPARGRREAQVETRRGGRRVASATPGQAPLAPVVDLRAAPGEQWDTNAVPPSVFGSEPEVVRAPATASWPMTSQSHHIEYPAGAAEPMSAYGPVNGTSPYILPSVAQAPGTANGHVIGHPSEERVNGHQSPWQGPPEQAAATYTIDDLLHPDR